MGCGLGLRTPHYPAIIDKWPKVDWFEAISENYMDSGGRPIHILEQVRAHYPVALHGIALSIGSVDSLNQSYLQALKKLVDRIDPFIVSDHLCWSGVGGEQLHDLLPLPFTEEAIQHVVRRVEYVQEFLGRRILLENASTYVTFQYSMMPEWEFITQIAKRSGCGILLDLNNIYVNSVNHKFNPYDYLKNVPGELVGQFHLAGHTDMGDFLFDTHSAPVIEKVWDLYREALRLWGPVSTLIEWDAEIPTFERLLEEAEKAKKIYREFDSSAEWFAGGSSRSRSKLGAAEGGFERRERRRAPAAGAGEPPVPKANPSALVSLSESQEWMKERIQPGHHAKSFPKLLNPQGKASGEERMSVYANGYVARIHESLVEVFEAVHTVLGDNSFLELCHAYAKRYPSHDYNLNLVGRHLAEFLAGSKWTKQAPFLADLAQLEWQIWEAFHAFDGAPFRPGEIANIPAEEWEHLGIVFQPSVSLLSSSWLVLDIWRARREKENKVDLKNRPQRILIGRKNDQVRCELLDEHQFALITGLLKGKTLGEMCGELAETSEEAELPVTAWFSRWIGDGLILRIEMGTGTKYKNVPVPIS